MAIVEKFHALQIGVGTDSSGENVVNAYDVLRAFQVPRSDSDNCSKTLKDYVTTHDLTFSRARFKSPGRKATWAPSCNILQMIELIMVLPGELAAAVRKAAAIVFAHWLGAGPTQMKTIRQKQGVRDPFESLEDVLQAKLQIARCPPKPPKLTAK
jgi:hypothetical protein